MSLWSLHVGLVLLTCSVDYNSLKSSDFYVGLLLLFLVFLLFSFVWAAMLLRNLEAVDEGEFDRSRWMTEIDGVFQVKMV